MILSLFSGCGGLDLGFERAGFVTGLAYDVRPFSISSWNRNRSSNPAGRVADITQLRIDDLDRDFGGLFRPSAVIGGPPCQSFTNANSWKQDNDPRERLVGSFFDLALEVHRKRGPLDFIVMENVRELSNDKYGHILKAQIKRLQRYGFSVRYEVLDAADYNVPQRRKRLFLVAYNGKKFPRRQWQLPRKSPRKPTVGDAIKHLSSPVYFSREVNKSDIPVHENHWCMTPKSRKFFDGSLAPGKTFGRSFKTLSWDEPSYTVSYGNREVHVHPSGRRRLSVYEALLLQGFPKRFTLDGNLSQQITQVSEAVPPPLAHAIARSVKAQLYADATPSAVSETSSSSNAEAA